MSKPKLYINGCSFMAGVGVEYNDSIPGQFILSRKYDVTDHSRGGQSNLSIALDIQKNIHDHDIFLIAWTTSDRLFIRNCDVNIDIMPLCSANVGDLSKFEIEIIQDLAKLYYSVYDDTFHNDMSDMYVDSMYAQLKYHGKQVIFLTWEDRNVECPIYKHPVHPKFRLDDGHLNERGLQELYWHITGVLMDE